MRDPSEARSLSLANDEAGAVTILIAGFGGALGVGLRNVIADADDLRVISHDRQAGISAAIASHRPSAVLVNYDALAAPAEVRRLAATRDECSLVVATMRPDPELREQLFAAGARIVVPITLDGADLRAALRLAARGFVARPAVRLSSNLGLLTKREMEVLEHLLERRTAREIGDALHVTVGTVNTHCRHIYEKLGVHSRSELAREVNLRRANVGYTRERVSG